MSKKINILGKQFGDWKVIGDDKTSTYKVSCQCVCGVIKAVDSYTLRKGLSKGCGCKSYVMNRAKAHKAITTHGMSKSPEFNAWRSMKQRCYDTNVKNYYNYGGRGITVCDGWLDSFETFYNDIGPRPSSKYSIDRIDNDGNYEPGNVKWSTKSEQLLNRRLTVLLSFEGTTYTVDELAQKTGLRSSVIRDRLRYNWPVERIISTPTKAGNYYSR